MFDAWTWINSLTSALVAAAIIGFTTWLINIKRDCDETDRQFNERFLDLTQTVDKKVKALDDNLDTYIGECRQQHNDSLRKLDVLEAHHQNKVKRLEDMHNEILAIGLRLNQLLDRLTGKGPHV